MSSSIQKITRRKTGKQITSYRAFIAGRHMDRRISRIFPRKALAQDWINELLADPTKAAALAHGDSVRLFSDLCDRYMEQYTGKDTSHHTRGAFWRGQLGHLRLKDITPDRVRRVMQEFGDGTAKIGRRGKAGKHTSIETGKRRAPSTVNRYTSNLGAIQKFAKNRYGLVLDLLSATAHRTEGQGRVRFLSNDERNSLLEACQASDWVKLKLVVLMALYTGGRRSELLRLRWNDIDFARRTGTLHETKNGDRRSLLFPQIVITELMKFREVGNGLVFCNPGRPRKEGKERRSDPNTPYEFRYHWDKAVSDAGLENFRFHDLRHTCASYLAQNGASLLQIGGILGHRNTQTTLRYSHLVVADQQSLIDAMAANIGKTQQEDCTG
jgi:integrase